MALMPENFKTKCKTAQLKNVKKDPHDIGKDYWCCWVTDENQKKFFAMYDGKDTLKIKSEEAIRSYIIKSKKG